MMKQRKSPRFGSFQVFSSVIFFCQIRERLKVTKINHEFSKVSVPYFKIHVVPNVKKQFMSIGKKINLSKKQFSGSYEKRRDS